jgi:hypothetical protein
MSALWRKRAADTDIDALVRRLDAIAAAPCGDLFSLRGL